MAVGIQNNSRMLNVRIETIEFISDNAIGLETPKRLKLLVSFMILP